MTILDKKYQNNALMIAIAKGRQHKDTEGDSIMTQSPLIDELLKHPTAKNAVNLADALGMTALHLAILQRDIVSVKILISLGADGTIENKERKTAFDYLNISYEEANEHLDAYTTACHSRTSYLKVLAQKNFVGKAAELLSYKIYTMPGNKLFKSEGEEICNYLISEGLLVEEGKIFSNFG